MSSAETMRRDIRACVHCGLCLPSCPTYRLTGDERDSPRGRIILMRDMLAGKTPDKTAVHHLDRCLSCLHCARACPSGVNYMRLIDSARIYIARHYRRPWRQRLWRGLLVRTASSPRWFFWLNRLLQLMRFIPLLPLPARLRPYAGKPAAPALAAGRYRPSKPSGLRYALLGGCMQNVLAPEISAAGLRFFTRFGVEVDFVKACCGAAAFHLGDKARADRLMEDALAQLTASRPDALIADAAGCGLMLKTYRRGQTPEVLDFAEAAARLDLPVSAKANGVQLVYHGACALRHGQQIHDVVLALLRRIGFAVREPENAGQCCGWAGSYALLQPELSAALAQEKTAALNACGGDKVIAGNMGCLLHLQNGLAAPAQHIAGLLDWAYRPD